LFEVIETFGHALAWNLTDLLDKSSLKIKTITYVKDEGSNMNVMTSTLKFVVNCETIGLQESFNGKYFGHDFSKTC
jgi:hypothetical protein